MDAPEEVSQGAALEEYRASRQAAAGSARSRVRGRGGQLLRVPLVIPSVPEFLARAAAASSEAEAAEAAAGSGGGGMSEEDKAEERRERRRAARRKAARAAALQREAEGGGADGAAAVASKRQRGLLPKGALEAPAAQPRLLAPGMAVHIVGQPEGGAALPLRRAAGGAAAGAGPAAAALDPAAAFLQARLGAGRLKRK